jgi:DNA-directed RNA polymerase specialized sigma24 family protein
LKSSLKEKQFQKVKADGGSSNSEDIIELFRDEREYLYDYLMRMTGQISRSADTIDEVFANFTQDTFARYESWEALKLSLYKTARSFAADIWGADTAHLINTAFKSKDEEARDVQGKFLKIDSAFKELNPKSREALQLLIRNRLSPPHTVSLMETKPKTLEEYVKGGLDELSEKLGQDPEAVQKQLVALPMHPLPEIGSHGTMELSMMISDIKTRPKGLRSPLTIAVLLTALFIFISIVFFPDGLGKPFWDIVRQLLGEI